MAQLTRGSFLASSFPNYSTESGAYNKVAFNHVVRKKNRHTKKFVKKIKIDIPGRSFQHASFPLDYSIEGKAYKMTLSGATIKHVVRKKK